MPGRTRRRNELTRTCRFTVFQVEHLAEKNCRCSFTLHDSTYHFAGEDSTECVVCMSAPKDMAVLPCRHLCMCTACATNHHASSDKCPICRQQVQGLVQLTLGANVSCA
jgi:hypothetical protein